MIDHFVKPLGDDLSVTLWVGGEGEWFVGSPPNTKAVLTTGCVYLNNKNKLKQLDAITYSEIQRDLNLMAWFVAK
ncbi:MAG: hypothetical protein WAO71_00770 [Gallionella sp.]